MRAPATQRLMRFRATIEYHGGSFHGSQLQSNLPTVQGALESALSLLFDRSTRVAMAGRTDTGVHASAQEIGFTAPDGWHQPAEVERALQAVLTTGPAGGAIGVLSVSRATENFHPRFSASARRYRYVIARGGQRPFWRDRAWAVGWTLDVGVLNELAATIVGERSFEGFAKSGQCGNGFSCRVHEAAWRDGPDGLLFFSIIANRFLHRMVRYLVGTSVEISAGKRPKQDFCDLLALGNVPAETSAGAKSSSTHQPPRPPTPAPAEGLYMTGVRYDGRWNREHGIPWLPKSVPAGTSGADLG